MRFNSPRRRPEAATESGVLRYWRVRLGTAVMVSMVVILQAIGVLIPPARPELIAACLASLNSLSGCSPFEQRESAVCGKEITALAVDRFGDLPR